MKRCIFCNGNTAQMATNIDEWDGTTDCQVFCVGCGAKGPVELNQTAAEKSWDEGQLNRQSSPFKA